MPPNNSIGYPFVELSEVDSTNNYAMRQVQAQMAEHGSAWFAWYQNAGKGQRGKHWKAEAGLNIMMSVLIEPSSIAVDNQFLLNFAIALACHDLLARYTVTETSIKWPNDLYWRDRKAGGILIENVLQGKEWKFAIVGIGINVNQILFPPNLPNAVSLKKITGNSYLVIDLARELCACIDNRWQQLLQGKQHELVSDYTSNLYRYGQIAKFKKNNIIFEAKVAGVSQKGELLLETAEQLHIVSGTIEWIIP